MSLDVSSVLSSTCQLMHDVDQYNGHKLVVCVMYKVIEVYDFDNIHDEVLYFVCSAD